MAKVANTQVLAANLARMELSSYPHGDGLSIQDLMDARLHGGLTYNDFLVLPGYINFGASEVDLRTRVTRNVVLNLSLIHI